MQNWTFVLLEKISFSYLFTESNLLCVKYNVTETKLYDYPKLRSLVGISAERYDTTPPTSALDMTQNHQVLKL